LLLGGALRPAPAGSLKSQLFYLQSRGIGFEEAVSMMVSGFCRDVFDPLPMEFAAEADKLLALKLEGSVGADSGRLRPILSCLGLRSRLFPSVPL
jgi:hypothetical protein